MIKRKKKLKKTVVILSVLLLLALAVFAYMLWEYQAVGIKKIHHDNEAIAGITIVYAADFQYDMDNEGAVKTGLLQKSVDLINEQQPDLILLGGDYATYSRNASDYVPYLSQLSAPLGVFAVFGNHDYDRELLKQQLADNILFLENETATVTYNGQSILIYGLEDLWRGSPSLENLDDAAAENAAYSILLSHNPDYFETLNVQGENPFDLTLSGHLHAGQVTVFGIWGWPFVVGTVSDYGEKYRYGDKVYFDSRIYITSGLGGHVFHQPLRFGAKPEIVVIS